MESARDYNSEGKVVETRETKEDFRGLYPILDEAGNLYWTAFEVFGSKLGEQFVHLLMAPVPRGAPQRSAHPSR